jgi:hypothetical protein
MAVRDYETSSGRPYLDVVLKKLGQFSTGREPGRHGVPSGPVQILNGDPFGAKRPAKRTFELGPARTTRPRAMYEHD